LEKASGNHFKIEVYEEWEDQCRTAAKKTTERDRKGGETHYGELWRQSEELGGKLCGVKRRRAVGLNSFCSRGPRKITSVWEPHSK